MRPCQVLVPFVVLLAGCGDADSLPHDAPSTTPAPSPPRSNDRNKTATDSDPFDFSLVATLAEEQDEDPEGAIDEFKTDFDPDAFVQEFSIDQIREEFPIKAGMTVEEVEQLAEDGDRMFLTDNMDELYNLGWEERSLEERSGWFYFWVNGKHVFHCDVVIEDERVASVWVMPGNREWMTYVFYRLSGSGGHVGKFLSPPSEVDLKIKSDEELFAVHKENQVKRVWLHSSRLTDAGMARVALMQNLEKLDFNYPAVTDSGLRHLAKLTNLRELNLGTVKVTDTGLEWIGGLTNLEKLSLWHCERITDKGLMYLQSLTNLRGLNLEGTPITDAGLEHLGALANLGELSLSFCAGISDQGLVHLEPLTRLKSLALFGTSITEDGVAELRKALPNCDIRR